MGSIQNEQAEIVPRPVVFSMGICSSVVIMQISTLLADGKNYTNMWTPLSLVWRVKCASRIAAQDMARTRAADFRALPARP